MIRSSRQVVPYDRPAPRADHEMDAVHAYVSKLNGIVTESLEKNRETIALVEIPKRDGVVKSPSLW